jgi:hypothetical protein
VAHKESLSTRFSNSLYDVQLRQRNKKILPTSIHKWIKGDQTLTKYLSLIVVGALLSTGCIATTDMIQDGHDFIQKTQENRIWGQNVVSVRYCRAVDRVDGFCPSRSQPGIQLVEAPGPKLVGAVLTSAAMVGSAGLLMNGLQTQRVPQLTGTTQNFDVSTFNTGVNYVPLKGAK